MHRRFRMVNFYLQHMPFALAVLNEWCRSPILSSAYQQQHHHHHHYHHYISIIVIWSAIPLCNIGLFLFSLCVCISLSLLILSRVPNGTNNNTKENIIFIGKEVKQTKHRLSIETNEKQNKKKAIYYNFSAEKKWIFPRIHSFIWTYSWLGQRHEAHDKQHDLPSEMHGNIWFLFFAVPLFIVLANRMNISSHRLVDIGAPCSLQLVWIR